MKDFSRYDIAQVIADEFDLVVSDIYLNPTMRLDSLTDGFDVMDRMRLCRKLEETFKVDIPWEADEDFETVQDIYEYMEQAYATTT